MVNKDPDKTSQYRRDFFVYARRANADETTTKPVTANVATVLEANRDTARPAPFEEDAPAEAVLAVSWIEEGVEPSAGRSLEKCEEIKILAVAYQ